MIQNQTVIQEMAGTGSTFFVVETEKKNIKTVKK